VLRKCTSTYPATPANSNVRTIPHLRELFGCEVGVTDHSIVVGEVFTPDNLRAIRPGLGLAPKHAETIMGRRARQPLKRGTPLDWSLFE
jgi:sialic acid synthase SpsE